MENPEAKSKWDDLVRELAVEIPPEVQQREEAVAAAKPQAAAPPSESRETVASPAPSPKRSATNWNSLGSGLRLAAVGGAGADCGCPSRQAGSSEASFATGTAARTERSRSKHGAVGRSARIVAAKSRSREATASPRPSASNRGHVVNAPEQGGEQSEPRREAEQAANKAGHAANAQIEIASKPSRVGKLRNKAANNPNLGGKAADNEVDVVAEDAVVEVAINGTIKVKAIVAVDVVAVVSRIVIVARARTGTGARRSTSAGSGRSSSRTDAAARTAQKPAAVSLWHKIFGSPAEQTAKVVDEPVDEVGSPSDLRNEPRSAGSGFSDAHPDDQMQMFDE